MQEDLEDSQDSLVEEEKLIAGGVEAVGTIFAFKALEDAFTKNLGPEESVSIDNDIPVSGYQGGGLVCLA